MPRLARKKSRSGIYHIIIRGINRQTIFEDDEDKFRFLETMEKYKSIGEHEIYSYCLMNNHIHLLWKESESESLSTVIKRISSSYVYWYNLKYDRSGHLFQGRFKSEIVEDESYFLTVLRYIHQNPVKAGIVVNVYDYRWSSYHEYLGNNGKIVNVDFALRLFAKDREKGIRIYIKYMQEENEDECLDIYIAIKKSDQEVRDFLKQLGIATISVLQQMEKRDRDIILAKLKEIEGVSIRQLSRITGISRSVIGRAGGTGPSSHPFLK